MHATFDPEHNIAYVSLKEIEPGEATVQIAFSDPRMVSEIVLDLDRWGALIGIEVFDAQPRLPQELLNEAERPDGDSGLRIPFHSAAGWQPNGD
jgi:uncharacterized protein YuzE